MDLYVGPCSELGLNEQRERWECVMGGEDRKSMGGREGEHKLLAEMMVVKVKGAMLVSLFEFLMSSLSPPISSISLSNLLLVVSAVLKAGMNWVPIINANGWRIVTNGLCLLSLPELVAGYSSICCLSGVLSCSSLSGDASDHTSCSSTASYASCMSVAYCSSVPVSSLLDFLLPPSPFTFDVLSPLALRDPLLSLRRQSASIV